MDAVAALLAGYRSPNGSTPGWLAELRESGRARFAELGLPTTRHEEWKYTNVAPISRLTLQTPPEVCPAVAPGDLGGLRLTFVNGRFDAARSVLGAEASGVAQPLVRVLDSDIASLDGRLGASADRVGAAFVALNTALFEDGAVVRVPRGVHIEAPIELLFLAGGEHTFAQYPRVLLILEEGSSATVVERYVGESPQPYLTNAVTEAVLEPGSSLRHVKVQAEADNAFHVGTLSVDQQRGSEFVSHSFALGGQLARTDITSVLAGTDASCGLDGLYVVRGRQLVDHHTTVDHRSPRCSSRELYKGVLEDASTGVFNGKVFVRQDAQKSDAQQLNKNLLLSDAATIDTKPQLEILADDVKCSHGATIGRLDPAAHFYLRSRGIDAASAREMLIVAFANEMIGRLPVAALRVDLERSLAAFFRRPDMMGDA